MGALSDPDSFQPNLVQETPQEVTAKRRALQKQFKTWIPQWPYEVSRYEEAGLEVPKEPKFISVKRAITIARKELGKKRAVVEVLEDDFGYYVTLEKYPGEEVKVGDTFSALIDGFSGEAWVSSIPPFERIEAMTVVDLGKVPGSRTQRERE